MPTLTLVHLYPDLLNLYGDRGNIIALSRRCAWRDIELRVVGVGLGGSFSPDDADILFIGGDQDREQTVVADDIRQNHAASIRAAVDRGTPFLAVCGGYQLLQRFYRAADGEELEGMGIFDAYTIHPGRQASRCVGNVVVEWELGTIVGFENHGGRTFLQGQTKALGSVLQGYGNNGQDGTEGARVANVFGTYVHGSLLPKNPAFADLLLTLALEHRYPDVPLESLDDDLELSAHAAAHIRAEKQRG
jgi:lipid II isoglutaminyl synthase (glutamine-hydrolysing)